MGSPAQITDCPRCRHSNPSGSLHCAKCNTPLSSDADTTIPEAAPGWSMVGPGVVPMGPAALVPGSLLANRYEILQMLGEGGMGTVYKARDRELDRLLAVKVIRPELAGNPKILARFKQELILARQVTHKNVIRIYDLGVAEGLKFITMEFIEGRDLASLLQERRPTHDESLRIVRQVARALEAAHAEGVVHRDLKPQNIMIDGRGRVSVMDFGLARSVEMHGMTQTGMLMGTPTYMSPEQAQGRRVDARSDLFSLGIIFYEMLTGQVPFQADTVLASLLKRTQEPAPPPRQVDPSVPEALNAVVVKCLAIDPDQRYQSTTEVVRDLDTLAGDTPGASLMVSMPGLVAAPPASKTWRWVAVGLGALVLVMVIAAVLLRDRFLSQPATPRKAVTLIVADFSNATGDPVFDGTLEPMFTLAMEGASFINSVRRDQALRIAAQLQPGATRLDEAVARLVAVREGISAIVAGSVQREGGGYKVSVRALDGVTGNEIASRELEASSKEKVLATVGKLAAPIRKALGDATPESVQLAAAETYTAASLEAAHSYAAAQQLRFAGKNEEAIKEYLRAIQLDSNFGSAYGSLAAMYANLGRREESTKYYQMAMGRIERMTDREKYRTRGGYYLASMDHQKAIDEFTELVKRFPADATGLSNLAFAYYLRRDMAQALAEGRRALEIYPKNVPYRNNVALYALYGGEFETAAKEARAALDLNPSYLKGYVTLALSELAQSQPAKAAETYRKLEAVSTLGASFAATGLADLALFEGRGADAQAILEKAIAADLANNNATGAGKKSAMLAEAQLALGNRVAALAASERAAKSGSELSAVFVAARVYLEAGQEAKAAAIAAELGRRLEPVPQAFARLMEGELQLKRGRAREAIQLFQEAQKLSDTWLGRFDLGRAYLEAGAFPQADSEFDKCLKRRGEASDVFFDELQTYHYFPPVHYYLGRAREGLNSPGAADAYRAFLALREKGGADPLLADARKRLGGR